MKRIKEAVRAWKLNRKTFACLLDISTESTLKRDIF